MIDFNKLNSDYEQDKFYSLQLEIGDKCYQACNYCYMNAVPEKINELSDETIIKVLNSAKKMDISAIEWLGGEPLLRESVFDFLEHANILGLKNNMWTGGLVFKNKKIADKTARLCKNGLISFHLSSSNEYTYKKLHPGRPASDLRDIINGVKYLLDIGYPNSQLLNSVTFTGLQTADDMIETMEFFYENFGISTSLNVYHTYLRPGYSDEELAEFIPDKSEVAKVYKKYKSFLNIKNLPLNCVNKQYCSATLAVLNDGSVTPCATIRDTCKEKVFDKQLAEIANNNLDYLLFNSLKNKDNLHKTCQDCAMNDICWGCRSRAFAVGNGELGKDPRCFRK